MRLNFKLRHLILANGLLHILKLLFPDIGLNDHIFKILVFDEIVEELFQKSVYEINCGVVNVAEVFD